MIDDKEALQKRFAELAGKAWAKSAKTFYHGSPNADLQTLRIGSYVTPDLYTAKLMGRFHTDTGKTWSDEDLAEDYEFGTQPKWKQGREPAGNPAIYKLRAAIKQLNLLDNPYEHTILEELPVEAVEKAASNAARRLFTKLMKDVAGGNMRWHGTSAPKAKLILADQSFKPGIYGGYTPGLGTLSRHLPLDTWNQGALLGFNAKHPAYRAATAVPSSVADRFYPYGARGAGDMSLFRFVDGPTKPIVLTPGSGALRWAAKTTDPQLNTTLQRQGARLLNPEIVRHLSQKDVTGQNVTSGVAKLLGVSPGGFRPQTLMDYPTSVPVVSQRAALRHVANLSRLRRPQPLPLPPPPLPAYDATSRPAASWLGKLQRMTKPIAAWFKASAEKQADLLPGIQLQPHQQRIADEMTGENPQGSSRMLVYHGLGSGKSLSALAAAEAAKKKFGDSYGVVVPAALKGNFNKEIKKFTNSDPEVMSYTALGMGKQFQDPPETLIMDEAHRLRNPDGDAANAASQQARSARNLLLLTGSPITNSPTDLANLLSLLHNKQITPEQFDARYIGHKTVNPGIINWFRGIKPGEQPVVQNEKELRGLLKHHVDYQPSKNPKGVNVSEETIHVPLSPAQQKIQKAVRTKIPPGFLWKLDQEFPLSRDELAKLNSFMTGLRQVSMSTRPFRADKDPYKSFEQSSKLQLAMKNLQSTLGSDPRKKAIIYSNHIDAGLSPYAAALEKNKIPHALFHGSISPKERQRAVEEYNAGKLRALLIGPAGAEGLSTKGTSLIQLLDPHWHESRSQQARGRGLRFDSHEGLPEELKNVAVQRYLSSSEDPSWIGKLMGYKRERTGDEVLARLAANKEMLNDKFRDILKEEGTQKTSAEIALTGAREWYKTAAFPSPLGGLLAPMKHPSTLTPTLTPTPTPTQDRPEIPDRPEVPDRPGLATPTPTPTPTPTLTPQSGFTNQYAAKAPPQTVGGVPAGAWKTPQPVTPFRPISPQLSHATVSSFDNPTTNAWDKWLERNYSPGQNRFDAIGAIDKHLNSNRQAQPNARATYANILDKRFANAQRRPRQPFDVADPDKVTNEMPLVESHIGHDGQSGKPLLVVGGKEQFMGQKSPASAVLAGQLGNIFGAPTAAPALTGGRSLYMPSMTRGLVGLHEMEHINQNRSRPDYIYSPNPEPYISQTATEEPAAVLNELIQGVDAATQATGKPVPGEMALTPTYKPTLNWMRQQALQHQLENVGDRQHGKTMTELKNTPEGQAWQRMQLQQLAPREKQNALALTGVQNWCKTAGKFDLLKSLARFGVGAGSGYAANDAYLNQVNPDVTDLGRVRSNAISAGLGGLLSSRGGMRALGKSLSKPGPALATTTALAGRYGVILPDSQHSPIGFGLGAHFDPGHSPIPKTVGAFRDPIKAEKIKGYASKPVETYIKYLVENQYDKLKNTYVGQPNEPIPAETKLIAQQVKNQALPAVYSSVASALGSPKENATISDVGAALAPQLAGGAGGGYLGYRLGDTAGNYLFQDNPKDDYETRRRQDGRRWWLQFLGGNLGAVGGAALSAHAMPKLQESMNKVFKTAAEKAAFGPRSITTARLLARSLSGAARAPLTAAGTGALRGAKTLGGDMLVGGGLTAAQVATGMVPAATYNKDGTPSKSLLPDPTYMGPLFAVNTLLAGKLGPVGLRSAMRRNMPMTGNPVTKGLSTAGLITAAPSAVNMVHGFKSLHDTIAPAIAEDSFHKNTGNILYNGQVNTQLVADAAIDGVRQGLANRPVQKDLEQFVNTVGEEAGVPGMGAMGKKNLNNLFGSAGLSTLAQGAGIATGGVGGMLAGDWLADTLLSAATKRKLLKKRPHAHRFIRDLSSLAGAGLGAYGALRGLDVKMPDLLKRLQPSPALPAANLR